MASWKLGTRTRGIALRWTLVVVAVGCSNSGGTGVKPTTCTGSGMVPDPTGHGCTQPQPPIQGCPAASFMGSESTYFTTSTPPFEAEMKLAVDPRPNQNTVFVATIQTDTGPSNPGAPTATCVTGKHIAVYKSDGNGGLVAMTGLPAAPAHEWATDPNVAVGSDGTLYLSFLRWIGPCGADTSTSCNTCSSPSRAVTDVEIWFAPPGSNTLLPGLGDDPALDQAIMATPNSSFPAQLSAIPGTESGVDHPFIAVNPAVPGQLVVYVSGDLNPDVVYTLQKNGNAPGALSMSLAKLPLPTQMSKALNNLGSLFVNPAFDASGALYLAIGELIDASDTAALHVQKYTATNGAWQLAVDVMPPVPVGFTYAIANPQNDVINVPSSTPAASFLTDPTPAIAVGALNGSSDPVVYVAFEVTGSNGVRQIALEAANGRDVTQWTTPVVVPIPSGASLTFHPGLSLDTTNNALDLVEYALKQVGQTNQLSNINLNTYLTRFDAARLQPVFSPLLLNRAAPPLSLLPSRPESTSGIIFAGDYSTVATKGLNAFVAWPELGQGPVTGDLGFAEISGSCTNSVTLVDPDSLWECSCQCGSGEFNFFGVVGCAPASATTVASACSSVCTQNVLCGTALSCPPSMVCGGTAISGQVLSTQSCAVTDGPPTGAAPASTADFLISGAAASQAVMTVAAAQPVATPVTGQAFFNASTSPPIPGAVAGFARLAIQPADFFLGGPSTPSSATSESRTSRACGARSRTPPTSSFRPARPSSSSPCRRSPPAGRCRRPSTCARRTRRLSRGRWISCTTRSP